MGATFSEETQMMGLSSFVSGATRFALVLTMIASSGCILHARGGVRARPPRPRAQVVVRADVAPPPPVQTTVVVQAPQPQLATGVTVVEVSCAQGAQEVCNGLDDNCDGQIDEGCGYSSGDIQITLFWQGGADIDMYVTDPMGETISYSHTQSQSGGHLDQDARGDCLRSQANPTIENVYWGPNPPSGRYQIELHHFSACRSGGGATPVTVSIAVGGQVIGAYNYTITPNDRIAVATFDIP